jgi:hypothetical protein
VSRLHKENSPNRTWLILLPQFSVSQSPAPHTSAMIVPRPRSEAPIMKLSVTIWRGEREKHCEVCRVPRKEAKFVKADIHLDAW